MAGSEFPAGRIERRTRSLFPLLQGKPGNAAVAQIKAVGVEDGKDGKGDHQERIPKPEPKDEHRDKHRSRAAERSREQQADVFTAQPIAFLAAVCLRLDEAEGIEIHRQNVDGDEDIEKNGPAHIRSSMCGLNKIFQNRTDL